jgi:HNH endonuclease
VEGSEANLVRTSAPMVRAPLSPSILCPLCPNPLDDSDEHILLSALGGRLHSKKVLCSACNTERYSTTLDSELASALGYFTTVLNVLPGRGGEPPPFRGLKLPDGTPIALQPGGQPVRSKLEFSKNLEPDGKTRISIIAGDPFMGKPLRDTLEGVARKANKTSEELLQGVKLERIGEYANNVKLSIGIGDPAHLRAIAKMGITYAAYHLGTDIVRQPQFDTIRSFVVADTGKDLGLVGWANADDFPAIEGLHAQEPPNHRLVLSCNPHTGLVSFFVELFGAFCFSVLLSEQWSGQRFTAAYSQDPLTGGRIEAVDFPPSGAPVAEFLGRKLDMTAIQQRGNRLLAFISKRQEDGALSGIVERSFKEVQQAVVDGMNDDEAKDLLSALIGQRATEYTLRIPTRTPLTINEVLGKKRK